MRNTPLVGSQESEASGQDPPGLTDPFDYVKPESKSN